VVVVEVKAVAACPLWHGVLQLYVWNAFIDMMKLMKILKFLIFI